MRTCNNGHLRGTLTKPRISRVRITKSENINGGTCEDFCRILVKKEEKQAQVAQKQSTKRPKMGLSGETKPVLGKLRVDSDFGKNERNGR